jgi:hypothetical protein
MVHFVLRGFDHNAVQKINEPFCSVSRVVDTRPGWPPMVSKATLFHSVWKCKLKQTLPGKLYLQSTASVTSHTTTHILSQLGEHLIRWHRNR